MAVHVGAIDQGTTSTRFMIFDLEGHEIGRHQLEHEQILPRAGWVEHDPHEIWEATQDVIGSALGKAGVTAPDLAAIGITNQRGTAVVWDRRTGEPYYNAIVWRDTRVTAGGRIQWILENVDGVRADAEAGHAIFGTIDSWLMWWLTGGPDDGLHLTDVTNASHTMLMDLETLAWDGNLLDLLGIPASMLPQIRSSSEVYGHTVADGPFGGEVAVAGDLADQQATMVGQVCFEPGALSNIYGTGMDTGNVLMLNTGSEIVGATRGLITTVAYKLGDRPAVYALEGSIAATESQRPVPMSDRAEIEAICHESKDLLDVMVVAAHLDPTTMRVAGGVTSDERWMQIQADVLAVSVVRPVVAEAAALGAACAAGLAVGSWSTTDDLVASWNESARWEPT
ncbi:FGGY family carbohydrate kinase [Aeromicrobium sp.]|uniref:FGGY family carbohydrate kinase n=1 Tax=Aeromicrobium sp. TaxID=1871063 RepID=UPI0019B533B2|nr:FGGY family carbohydrate kinase [Aeromicrobium sp.]MBC7631790.1 glycerol kinase [Aeromicrobium sp.]